MGRKRIYASDAERAKAFRERKALQLERLTKKAARTPKKVVVEKVVEKIVEIEKPISKSAIDPGPAKFKRVTEEDRQAFAFAKYATGNKCHPNVVKKLKMATKRAVNALHELSVAISYSDETHKEALQRDSYAIESAIGLLLSYSKVLNLAHTKAIWQEKVREDKEKRDFEAQVKKTIVDLFGKSPDPDVVKIMAVDILEFYDISNDWLCDRYNTTLASVSLYFAHLNQNDPIEKLLPAIAECRIKIHPVGRKAGNYWFCGWEDFEIWRREKAAKAKAQLG